MKQLHLAVIGFGKVGMACAKAIREDERLVLAGIVRRSESLAEKLPAPFTQVPVVSHASELKRVDAALICVPTEHVLATAHDLLQHRIPIVECAVLHDEALRNHQTELNRVASHNEVPAIVGAGWDPGALSLFRALFALLIPNGRTETSWHTSASLHHTTAVHAVPGVREALSTELRNTDGRAQRYIYVELEHGADLARIEAAILSDPLFLGEETLVFPVESVRALEETGRGVLLERRGTVAEADHQMLLFEGRYSEPALTAVVMVSAARAIPSIKHGVRNLLDLPLGRLWGDLRLKAGMDCL